MGVIPLMKIVRENQNMCVPWYLMAAFAYYVEDRPIISDDQFDWLAMYMLAEYDNIEHMHKHLINKGHLEAGTYLGDYPSIIGGGVASVRQQYKL